MKSEKHICSVCGERIFRYGYNIDGELHCNKCMNKKYMVKFDRKEYLLDQPEGSSSVTK